ncbi:hypothetical protein CRYUN_Cryun12cG0172200 [Craigia yunnanensis]
MADTEGSVPLRVVQWAFIGSPRAKKHVYAEMLSKLLEVPHISIASLVRQELSPHSNFYKLIANAVNHGELVQEDIIFGLLLKRLEDGYYRGETGWNSSITHSGLQHLICLYSTDRLQDYTEQSKPLEDYYKNQKKLLDFQVGSVHVETWRELLIALHLFNM